MAPSNSKLNSPAVLTQQIAGEFASLPQVDAVALAGSKTSEFPDGDSDVDLYVYVSEDIPLELRASIAKGALRAEIGNMTWEPGDEWIDPENGTAVDIMYRHVRWIEEQLDRVLVQHQASVGYSTCFWYNVLNSQPLFDRTGWFAEFQRQAKQPYPQELKKAIITKNYRLLRDTQSSYLHQIELAVKRSDSVSVNHRVAALVASYFDVLFAVNELAHPGEKRLLQHAARCAKKPADMERQVRSVIRAIGNGGMVGRVNELVDGLEELLLREGIHSDSSPRYGSVAG